MSDLVGQLWSSHLGEVQTVVDESFKKLHKIWHDCGYGEDACERRRNTVVSHVKDLLCDMLKEETLIKNKLIEKIEETLKEINLLAKELRCEISTADFENLPLNKMERALRNTMEQHRLKKQERQNKLLELREKEEELCRKRGTKPVHLPVHVPTDEELETFQRYLKEEQQQLAELQTIYNRKRTEIVKIAAELEFAPSLQFEVCVINDNGSFVYTDANMNELENLRCKLANDLQERKAFISELSAKLTELWDKISEDIEYRQQFLSGCRGYGMKTVNRMKNELARLEEIKRKNIKKFVDAVREDLEEWWQRCYYSEDQKQLFLPFRSDCYTEDLLELHEMEVQKMKRFYESNINIFQLMKQRQDLWNKMLDIENRSHDKKRLGNRGGQLLQEERERKKIKKDLPKIENVLLKYLVAYELENKAPFLLNGEVLSEVIKKQWQEHTESKEQDLLARKKMRDQQSGAESTYGARSISKDSISKRKRCESEERTPQKHARVAACGTTVSTNKTSSLARSGKTVSTNKTSSHARRSKSRDDFARRKAARKNLHLSGIEALASSSNDAAQAQDMSIASTALSYTHFKGHLEMLNTETECRSSVKPGKCATPAKPPRRALTPRNFGTPRLPAAHFKTPANRTPATRTPLSSTPATVPRRTTPRVKMPFFY